MTTDSFQRSPLASISPAVDAFQADQFPFLTPVLAEKLVQSRTKDSMSVLSPVKALQDLAVQGSLIRKDVTNCIKSYSASLQSDYKSILAVTDSHKEVNRSLLWLDMSQPYADSSNTWTCKYMQGLVTAEEQDCSWSRSAVVSQSGARYRPVDGTVPQRLRIRCCLR